MEKISTYPGLDITAGVFPFFGRIGAGGGGTGSETFCLLGRLVDVAFTGSGSGSGSGLSSRAGALRFREDGGGGGRGVDDEAATGPVAIADEPDEGSEAAACRAAERVILFEGMSKNFGHESVGREPKDAKQLKREGVRWSCEKGEGFCTVVEMRKSSLRFRCRTSDSLIFLRPSVTP
jgi:hypothetical protein